MKAVILPTGKPGLLKPLTEWMPEFLLPVVNKPMVEHLIELLVRHNIKDIILVLKHMPYETEQYFGNGERWGAQISYSLEKAYEGISPCLRHIRSRLDDSFLCLPGNIVTNIDISGFLAAHEKGHGEITISRQKNREGNDEAKETEELSPFIMNPKALSSVLAMPAVQDLKRIITSLADQGFTLNTFYSSYNFITIQSPNDYLEVNKLILKGEFPGIIVPGRELQTSIWVGRHTKIRPDARICPPSLIGSHCSVRSGSVIGEDTIVGDNVIVDRDVSIEGSVILGNTYIGSHTEIKDSVIRKNSMINVPQLLNVYVGDDFILGDLDKRIIAGKGERLFNLVLALLLLFVFSPIMAILYLYHLMFPSRKYFTSEERFGSYEVVDLQGNMKPKGFDLYIFLSKNRLIGKLPGLFNVVKGDMNLVGNAPLTREEASSLKEEWETLRFKAPTGLFHLWEVEGGKDITWDEKLVTENYYATTHTFWGDVKILLRMFCRIWRI